MKSDGLPDNRVTCATCQRANLQTHYCVALRIGITPDLPLRCMSYIPDHIERDQEPGRDRWPGLAAELKEARRQQEAKGEGYDKERAGRVVPADAAPDPP